MVKKTQDEEIEEAPKKQFTKADLAPYIDEDGYRAAVEAWKAGKGVN